MYDTRVVKAAVAFGLVRHGGWTINTITVQESAPGVARRGTQSAGPRIRATAEMRLSLTRLFSYMR